MTEVDKNQIIYTVFYWKEKWEDWRKIYAEYSRSNNFSVSMWSK